MLIRKIILILYIIVAKSFVFGQIQSDQYNTLIKKANRFYHTRNYKSAAQTYSLAFKANNWKVSTKDRYNASCAWALAGIPDSAFFQLNEIISKDFYDDYNQLTEEHDLISLHKDKRWKKLLEGMNQNIQIREAQLNKPLIKQLDSIYNEDQKYRSQLKEIEKTYGFGSKETEVLIRKMRSTDSTNLIQIKHILDTYGWLGREVVGNTGTATLFLVIQHADLVTQEKYLPTMRDAVKNGKAEAYDLALLEDRVALRTHGKQIYGSQINRDPKTGEFSIAPIEDERNVDKRRASVGLESLQEYVKQWGINYKSNITVNAKKISNDDFRTALEINDSIIGPLNVSKGYTSTCLYTSKVDDDVRKENAAFFKFTINHDTLLTFDIVPEDATEDYDFAIFKCANATCITDIYARKIKPERYCLSINETKNGSTGLSEYEKSKYIGAGGGRGYASALPVKKGEAYYLMINYGESYFSRYHKQFPKGFTIYFYDYWPKKPKPLILKNVLFESNSAILLKDSFITLDTLIQKLQTNAVKIEIRGHTDNQGDEIKNQKLSEERAKAVVDYLISKKINPNRLIYKGFGGTRPLATNDTEEGRAKNRRVEFLILTPN